MAGVSEEHVIMLPFMAQGHLIPFLALAKQIQKAIPFTITILNTPQNINYLASTIAKTPLTNPKINLVSLPFDSEAHGLPPNVENTESLPIHQIITLVHASTSLEPHFCAFMSEFIIKNARPPICIISDVVMGWSNRVAQSFNTTNISFSTCGAYGTAAYLSIWQHLPHRSSAISKDGFFPLPGFQDTYQFHLSMLHQYIRAADGTDEWSKFFQPQLALSLNSFGWLCNSVEAVECTGVQILKDYTKLPIWCVGPLLPEIMLKPNKSISSSRIMDERTGKEPGLSPQKCVEWLDLHSKSSVLYISFGSQNTISPSQMMELAKGLEVSEKPFIWAIRPPVGFDPKGEFRSEWLPEGFEERVVKSNRGLLILKWAPQLDILCHQSTGAFLSHCGWNSVMESLSQGVPIIGWPLAAEQSYNAKMLVEEMGVCVELTRGRDSVLSMEEVKRVIEQVMGENGGEMRKKACETGELIRGAVKEGDDGVKGCSLQAMDDFLSTILSLQKNEHTNTK
ncbi:hypothetical protein LguiB_012573 [Lonicera macranthoides]